MECCAMKGNVNLVRCVSSESGDDSLLKAFRKAKKVGIDVQARLGNGGEAKAVLEYGREIYWGDAF